MDQLETWFGAQRLQRQWDRVRRFWDGGERCIVSTQSTAHAYRQCFDDQRMIDSAVADLEAMAKLPGLNMPSFFADFGTISTARYFGGKVMPPKDGTMIYIEPAAQTLDDALALRPVPVDDPNHDAAHGLRLFHNVRQRLDTRWLWLRTPDMQGILNTAGLVMNQEELLMQLFEDPDKTNLFIDRIQNHVLRYAAYLREQSGDRLCGNIWPYTFLPSDMGLSLTEDLMPLMSVEMYARFGIPRLRSVAQAVESLHIHCCGQWGRHAATLADSGLPIRAVEFHYPATTIEELRPLWGKAVFIPYLIQHQQDRFESITSYWRWLLHHTDPSVRFWFACPDDTQPSRDFAAAWERGDLC
ncbi:MAG: hypothetical protein IT440_15265 [Phycisphaeraceae bacterium]|nr:hypothetical protein [Phycisphaeraceae bacterium]